MMRRRTAEWFFAYFCDDEGEHVQRWRGRFRLIWMTGRSPPRQLKLQGRGRNVRIFAGEWYKHSGKVLSLAKVIARGVEGYM